MLNYFVLVLSCLVLVDAAKFKGKHPPSYLIPCSKTSPNLNTCALENGKKAIPSLLKGDKRFKIPVLTPLHLDRVEIKPSDTFELILTNVTLLGLENIDLIDIKIDEGRRHGEVTLTGTGLQILADYKVAGQILVLPISGEGKADLRFDDCTFHYTLDCELVKKSDGKEYGVIKKSDVTYKVNKAKFDLTNLFNGNKELGDNMIKVLNENPDAVIEDLSGGITAVIKTIANGVLDGVFGRIPYEEVFLP